jgi:hypothetical protein
MSNLALNVNSIPSFNIEFDVLGSGRVGEVQKGECPLSWNLDLMAERGGA